MRHADVTRREKQSRHGRWVEHWSPPRADDAGTGAFPPAPFVSLADVTGIASGVVQALAYLVYLRQVVAEDCRPNGMTWLMWSYGTALLLYVEIDQGAPFAALVLPTVCLLCSIAVASCAFARSAYIPPERQDWAVLSLDLGVSAGYVASSVVGDPAEFGLDTGLMFVLLTGLTTFTSSWPIMRTTYLDPQHERPLAWFVWALAYGLLALAVMLENMAWPYLAYPLIALLVHLAIGFSAVSGARAGTRSTIGDAGLSTPHREGVETPIEARGCEPVVPRDTEARIAVDKDARGA